MTTKNTNPVCNFIDMQGHVVYQSFYPYEPHAEWSVEVPCRIEFKNLPDVGGITPEISVWMNQCSYSCKAINKRAVEKMNEFLEENRKKVKDTYKKAAEDSNKAKSDILKLGLIMIPFYSIYRIGKIFVEGLRYGRDNWKKGVGDKAWQEERLEHALNHLFLYKEGDRSEDHLAKVAWFCVVQMELLRLEETTPEKVQDAEFSSPKVSHSNDQGTHSSHCPVTVEADEKILMKLQEAIDKIDNLRGETITKFI